MTVKLAALTAVMLLMLSGTAQAAVIEYYGIEAEIGEDASVLNDITMKFEEPAKNLEYQLDFRARDFAYNGTGICSLVDQGKRSKVLCEFGEGTRDVRFSLTTLEAIEGSEFSALYKVPMDTAHAFIQVKLPEKGVLAEDLANHSYTPANGKVMTDGKHIIVYWEMADLERGDDIYLSVRYDMPQPNYMLTGMVILSIAAAVGAGMYIVKGGMRRHPLTSVLNNDEKRIVELLSDGGGKVGQKLLVRETDFSKAKVSRLVKSLKQRGVVDTEAISGRENRVILKLKQK